MNFDPAIAAQSALRGVHTSGELRDDLAKALEAEERFSSSAGAEASAAYHELIALGDRHPDAVRYHAFLVYITWQQVTEHTVPEYFRRGLTLSQRYLERPVTATDPADRSRIEALHASFRAGLGLEDESGEEEYDKDSFKGGD